MAARKLTTGLTGLAVATSPHHTLGVLYGKILRCLQKMPSDSAYRRYTEQIISDRNNHVKTVRELCESLSYIYNTLICLG
nr:probable NADH dehydrogenase [ubiquinone] 1 alpha subcomplex subunit 5 [Penaeus vannamei]